jgi:hypothetical protein
VTKFKTVLTAGTMALSLALMGGAEAAKSNYAATAIVTVAMHAKYCPNDTPEKAKGAASLLMEIKKPSDKDLKQAITQVASHMKLVGLDSFCSMVEHMLETNNLAD